MIKTFDELRREVSKSFGELIPPHGFREAAREADSKNRFSVKQLQESLIAIYELLEEYSTVIERKVTVDTKPENTVA